MSAWGRLFASRRILLSRIFMLAFFLAVLFTESALEESLLSTALHEYRLVEPLIRLP